MRRTIDLLQPMLLALATAMTLAFAAPAAAEGQGDGASIRSVIEDQIAAFERDDLAAAFRHASPTIQGKFGTATRFGMMVERGYPMIRKPRRYELGALEEGPAGPVQIVTFVDQAGVSWEAEYRMSRIDGEWRIAGVMLRKLPGFST